MWLATEFNGGTDAVTYAVTIRDVDDNSNLDYVVERELTDTQFTIDINNAPGAVGLVLGTTYEFKVWVLNAYGRSPATSETLLFAFKPDPSFKISTTNEGN